mgnify:CR=1 FL=1|jgi:hypothetical protein
MKTAGFRIRVDPELRKAFIEACKESDLSAAHVLRTFMRQYTDSFAERNQGDLFDSDRTNRTGEVEN